MVRVLGGITLAPALALLAWLAAGRGADRADFVVASDVLRTVDPQRVSWLDEIQVASALYEGLTRTHPKTLLPEPGAASHWTVADGGMIYTFFLRPAARWSNGDELRAEHFRDAWLRVLDPKSESQYASLLFVIHGAEQYYRSRLNEDAGDDLSADRVGVAAVDSHTLRVRLGGPCPYFLDLTSFPTLAPQHTPTIEKWAYRDGRVLRATRHLSARPGTIVCNGAFVLERWDFKQRLLLSKNQHYWDRAGIEIDSIEIYLTGDPNAALIAYETGRVDLVRGVGTAAARALRAERQAGRRDDFHLGDRFATHFFRINCKRPPLDNPDLRKALALAIDKQALAARVLGLGERPVDTYVPRGALHLMRRPASNGRTIEYQPPDGLGAGLDPAQRLAAARELLESSGFNRIAADRPIELMFAEQPMQQRVAEAVQQMWERAGLRVKLVRIERRAISERIRQLDYDVVRSDWYGDYLDPATFLDMFTTHSGQNRTGWSNAEYDRLIAAAAAEADNQRRYALFRAAERILCEDELPIIPLFSKRGNYLLNPRIGGLHDNVRDILPIHRARLTAELPRLNQRRP